MNRKKLVFLGAKPVGYQCFHHLLSVKEELGIEVTGVLTQARKEFGSGHDLSELAEEYGIPVLQDLGEVPDCDIIYSVQYHEILKADHINKACTIAVNLHMAPLPEYRGCNQFSFAIVDGRKEFGTTLHRIDTRIDHGDILFQKRFPIPDNCWVNDLYQLTYDASVDLFAETLPALVAGDYSLTSQQSLVEQYGSSLHFRKEIAQLKQIDLGWDAERISRHVRATYMPGFEPPYTILDGKKIYFSDSYS